MKIMHLSDLHLGKNLNGFSLYEDQRHIHKQILQIAKEEAIDAVMIASDVFDKSVPTNQAIQLFDEFEEISNPNNFGLIEKPSKNSTFVLT